MKVSIIVTLYRGSGYISSVISMCDSALNKAGLLSNAELIFVNDYPEEYISVNKSEMIVKCINNPLNYGIHKSRVEGLKASCGDFIHFLDQDDEINENFYVELLKYEKNSDVIVGNGIVEKPEGNKKIYNTKLEKYSVSNGIWYVMLDNRIQSPGQCLIKRKAINGFWLSNIMYKNCADDLFLWLILLMNKKCFMVCDRLLYIHKYTGKNLSLNKKNEIESIEELYHILEKYNNGHYIVKLLGEKLQFLNGERKGIFYFILKIRLIRLKLRA